MQSTAKPEVFPVKIIHQALLMRHTRLLGRDISTMRPFTTICQCDVDEHGAPPATFSVMHNGDLPRSPGWTCCAADGGNPRTVVKGPTAVEETSGECRFKGGRKEKDAESPPENAGPPDSVSCVQPGPGRVHSIASIRSTSRTSHQITHIQRTTPSAALHGTFQLERM